MINEYATRRAACQSDISHADNSQGLRCCRYWLQRHVEDIHGRHSLVVRMAALTAEVREAQKPCRPHQMEVESSNPDCQGTMPMKTQSRADVARLGRRLRGWIAGRIGIHPHFGRPQPFSLLHPSTAPKFVPQRGRLGARSSSSLCQEANGIEIVNVLPLPG